MNFLLVRKYRYVAPKSIDDVIEDFGRITNQKWYDFSENIHGRLNPDNTFWLTEKWSFVYIQGLPYNYLSYINGKLQKDNTNTIIEISLRPNFILVFFLYLIGLFFVLELTGVKIMAETPIILTILGLLSFEFILFSIALISTNRLRNRFERILQLQRQK
jgi:hypothetical protein